MNFSLETIERLEREYFKRFGGSSTKQQQSLADRIRRSLSWIKRSVHISTEDAPRRFVDLWIALNSLYGSPLSHRGETEQETFKIFLEILGKDRDCRERLNLLLEDRRVKDLTKTIVQNKYLWPQFWSKNPNYRTAITNEWEKMEQAQNKGDISRFLLGLFERLNILRNQIFHGASSAATIRNKDSVDPGIEILEILLSCFLGLMVRFSPENHWPPLPFPGRGSPQHPE